MYHDEDFEIAQTSRFVKDLGRLRYLSSITRAVWFTLESFPCVSQPYNFTNIPRRWAEANLWPNHKYFTTQAIPIFHKHYKMPEQAFARQKIILTTIAVVKKRRCV